MGLSPLKPADGGKIAPVHAKALYCPEVAVQTVSEAKLAFWEVAPASDSKMAQRFLHPVDLLDAWIRGETMSRGNMRAPTGWIWKCPTSYGVALRMSGFDDQGIACFSHGYDSRDEPVLVQIDNRDLKKAVADMITSYEERKKNR